MLVHNAILAGVLPLPSLFSVSLNASDFYAMSLGFMEGLVELVGFLHLKKKISSHIKIYLLITRFIEGFDALIYLSVIS